MNLAITILKAVFIPCLLSGLLDNIPDYIRYWLTLVYLFDFSVDLSHIPKWNIILFAYSLYCLCPTYTIELYFNFRFVEIKAIIKASIAIFISSTLLFSNDYSLKYNHLLWFFLQCHGGTLVIVAQLITKLYLTANG